MDYQQILFPCDSLVFQSNENGVIAYDLQDKITKASLDFSFPSPISKSFETSNPTNFNPGSLLVLNDQIIFYSYIEKKIDLQSIPYNNNSIFLKEFSSISIDENNLISESPNSPRTILAENIPEDSYFVCSNSSKALLISPKDTFALIVSRKKVKSFPEGFASLMLSATFFDHDLIAFSTSNQKVHLYNLVTFDIITMNVFDNIVKMDVADLNPFERTLVCLTSGKTLLLIHFYSKESQIAKISRFDPKKREKLMCDSVLDFCIVHTPFDKIVVLPENGSIQFVSFEDTVSINSAVKSYIEALDSRMISGLDYNSKMRQRLSLRKSLATENPQLPIMIPMFGSKPENDQTVLNEFIPPDFWIENVQDATFEIHSNAEFPSSFNIALYSSKMSFLYYHFIERISDNSIRVSGSFIIDSMHDLDSFLVFVDFINENEQHEFVFAGYIDFPVSAFTQQESVTRIIEQVLVSFPPTVQFGNTKEQQSLSAKLLEKSLKDSNIDFETADNGVILHLKANSVEEFQKKVLFVLYTIPESSKIKKVENQHRSIEIAKEIVKAIEQFLQFIVMRFEVSIDKKDIILFRSKLDNLISSYFW